MARLAVVDLFKIEVLYRSNVIVCRTFFRMRLYQCYSNHYFNASEVYRNETADSKLCKVWLEILAI